MSLAAAIEKLRDVVAPTLEAVALPQPVELSSLLGRISDVRCTPEQFEEGAKELSATQAQALVTTTLHRTLAYGTELLRLEDARRLAEELVAAAGPEARFFSNCDVADELSGVCGWKFMVTAHTFESVLYCVGTNESALLVACDED